MKSVSDADSEVKNIFVGLNWTAVESRSLGLSHTFRTWQSSDIEDAGNLAAYRSIDLARRITSWNPVEASIGAAAINSMIEQRGEPCNIKEMLRQKARGRRVAFVGRFPFYGEIAEVASEAYLLEIHPVGNELPSFACEEILPASEINVISGTSLLNHSLQRLLELGRNSVNIVLGPTTPLSPVLFDFGADILGGIKVTDGKAVLRSVSQGVRMSKLLHGLERVCVFSNRKSL